MSASARRLRRGGDPLQRLLAKFGGPAGSVSISREDSGSNVAYWLSRPLGSGRYWSVQLLSGTDATSGKTITQLNRAEVRKPMVSKDEDDAEWTFHNAAGTVVGRTGSAGDWLNVSNASAFGGTYAYRGTSAAQAIGWHAIFNPGVSTVTDLALLYARLTNAGYAAVDLSLGGGAWDITLANACPTAQAEVTAGRLQATDLTTGGGTIDPTQRVVNLYGTTSQNAQVTIATGLAAGAWRAKFTILGKKDAANVSTDHRVPISGGMFATTTTTVADAVPSLVETIVGPGVSSVYEYALQPKPSGASTSGFVGNSHGGDNQTAMTVAVDGVTRTLGTNGDAWTGTEIVITRTSTLYHADDLGAGAWGTPIATCTVVYTLNRVGLKVARTIHWLVAGVGDGFSYTAMFPVNKLLDVASTDKATADASMNANDGTFKANSAGRAAYAWDEDGVYGACMYVPDLAQAVADYVYADERQLSWEDRTSGEPNKAYLARNDSTASSETIAVADEWKSVSYYLFQRFEDADAALGR